MTCNYAHELNHRVRSYEPENPRITRRNIFTSRQLKKNNEEDIWQIHVQCISENSNTYFLL